MRRLVLIQIICAEFRDPFNSAERQKYHANVVRKSSSFLSQGCEIWNGELPATCESDDVFVIERSDLPDNGLIRETQKICHFFTLQMQLESGIAAIRLRGRIGELGSCCEEIEQTRNPLLRCLATEQYHPVVSRIELVEAMLQHMPAHLGMLFKHRFEFGIPKATQLNMSGSVGEIWDLPRE